MHTQSLDWIRWSLLVEPGDHLAGVLTQALGPGPAWQWLAEQIGRKNPIPPPVEVQADWAKTVARWEPRAREMEIERKLEHVHNLGGQVITPVDKAWPAQFDDLAELRPFALWMRGNPASLSQNGVSIVGARTASDYGAAVAGDLAVGLAAAGLVVFSGGAYGIDAAAHRGCVAGGGVTVAFFAGGIDRYYPAANTGLFTQILQQGTIVSELAPGSPPTRSRFLLRNRLIAAVSPVCVVVEASYRSGALSTANHAADIGRHVCAVPGSVYSEFSIGCHQLLREGAVCVTSAEDVIELLRPGTLPLPIQSDTVRPGKTGTRKFAAVAKRPVSAPIELTSNEKRVWDNLPVSTPTNQHRLVMLTGLGVEEVMQSLGGLELAGLVQAIAGGWQRRGGSAGKLA